MLGIKVFKHNYNNEWYEIRIINLKTGKFISYAQDINIGFPFEKPFITTVQKMGYKNVKECIKALKYRGYIKQSEEITLKKQKQSEKIGYINLGVERIKRAKRINTNYFKDVVEKLKNYGIGFCDAQNIIIETYLNRN